MPSKNNSKNPQPADFTCEHNPFAIATLRNCDKPADTKILLALHVTATDDPIVMSEVIGSLLRFEKIHNNGEHSYNIVVECSDGQVGVRKDGKKDFNVREVMGWLVSWLTMNN